MSNQSQGWSDIMSDHVNKIIILTVQYFTFHFGLHTNLVKPLPHQAHDIYLVIFHMDNMQVSVCHQLQRTLCLLEQVSVQAQGDVANTRKQLTKTMTLQGDL